MNTNLTPAAIGDLRRRASSFVGAVSPDMPPPQLLARAHVSPISPRRSIGNQALAMLPDLRGSESGGWALMGQRGIGE
jgi:hypothetical protein